MQPPSETITRLITAQELRRDVMAEMIVIGLF
jgi:hypothetical protein